MFSKQVATLICLLLFSVSISAAVPNVVNYQGRLTDSSGDPVADDSYLVKFIIYDAAVSGTVIWNSTFQTINIIDGVFTYLLGSNITFPNNIFSDTNRYLGLTVGTDPEISPRTRFTTTPYAYRSKYADWSDFSGLADEAGLAYEAETLAGQSGAYYLDWNNLTNVPAGFADGTDDDSGGDITSVTAGTGLSGGGTSGDVSIDLATWIPGEHNFYNGTISFGDSTMKINNDGISIGNNLNPTGSSYLLRVARNYNTTGQKWGIYSRVENINIGHTTGVYGIAYGGDGSDNYGIQGYARKVPTTATTGDSYGVYARAFDGNIAVGVYGYASSANTNWAGYFGGHVLVSGNITKAGGSFRIDHPLDPENKYLQHSFVESPDMMNIYNGNIITDTKGYATVSMPEYFDALNKDFRYQLTVIGIFAQAIVAEKLSDRQFVIQTDIPDVEVSWQVTGVRKDVWANANRIEVEVDKLTNEIGTYLHSKEYGMPIERDANYKNIKESLDREQSNN